MSLRVAFIIALSTLAGCTGDSLFSCNIDSDCKPFGATLICDKGGHCATPGGADASIDLSDAALDGGADGSGPECTLPQQCHDPSKAFCDLQTMMCRGCIASDCMTPTPKCAPTGVCSQCLTKDDCVSTNQTCNQTTYSCGPCKQHTDCTTGVCTPNGTCAQQGTVAYVDNSNASCSDVAHTSSPTMPYCQVLAAVLTSGKANILVAGSSTAYNTLTLTTATTVGPVFIAGPGRNAVPTAKIAPAAAAAVLINTTGSPATVSIDGFELIGSGGGTPNPAVKCSQNTGAAMLTITNSSIHGSGQAGVDSSGCTVTLDANLISTNTGGGIKLADTIYSVSNNFITDNGLAGPGVLLTGNASGLFWFNTIAGNKRTGGATAGAFNCAGVTAATTPAIQASIIWGNDKATNSSVTTGCNFTHCDFDDSPLPSGAGNFSMDPLFTGDYHLQSTSPCKDKVTNATGLTGGTLPNHDVDQNPRPRMPSGGYDTGADQIVP